MNAPRLARVAALTLALSLPLGAPALAQAPTAVPGGVLVASTAPYKFKNCTALNKVYPHGVGRTGARDHTSGTRVTNFKKSTTLYKKVIGYHSGLDRDKDGIACEKH